MTNILVSIWEWLCSTCEFNISTWEVLTSIILFFGECFVLYLTWRMIKFARQYSKAWSNAFVVFGINMIIALFRRIMILLWALGLDGKTGIFIQWLDHVVLTAILTVGWAIFLILLLRWWGKYFAKYEHNAGLTVEREELVSKREDIATDRERLATKREDDVKKREIK